MVSQTVCPVNENYQKTKLEDPSEDYDKIKFNWLGVYDLWPNESSPIPVCPIQVCLIKLVNHTNLPTPWTTNSFIERVHSL